MSRRVLLRAHKNPFDPASAERSLKKRLLGDNAGNLAFSQASYRLLGTSDVEITTSKMLKLPAEQINDEYDAVVIPLANAFRVSFSSSLTQLADLLEHITIPVTILGVGGQAPLGKVTRGVAELDELVSRFVRAVLKNSPRLGVRGEATASYLSALGFGSEHVEIIGCPSMFMWGPDLSVRLPDHDLTCRSAISFNASPYAEHIGPISLLNARRYPHLMYAAQDIGSLKMMLSGEYVAGYTVREGTPTTLDHPLIQNNRIRFFLDPATWIDYLSTVDFSFGSRIHGNVVALLAGTPAIVLAHDSRTMELARYHQIPVVEMTGELEDFDARRLHAAADWTPTIAGHQERWDRFTGFLAEQRLSHTYLPGESPASFDEKLAACDLPPPVQMGHAEDPETVVSNLRDAGAWRRLNKSYPGLVSGLDSALGSYDPKTLARRARSKARRVIASRLDARS